MKIVFFFNLFVFPNSRLFKGCITWSCKVSSVKTEGATTWFNYFFPHLQTLAWCLWRDSSRFVIDYLVPDLVHAHPH